LEEADHTTAHGTEPLTSRQRKRIINETIELFVSAHRPADKRDTANI
jgi:hypothetical protein